MISRVFIERPRLAGVVSIVLTLAGGMTSRLLPGALLVGALAAATQLARQWRRRAYTARIHVQAKVTGDSRTHLRDAPTLPSLTLRCSLASAATEFRKPPAVLKTEAPHE